MKKIIEQRLGRRKEELEELSKAYNILVEQTNEVRARLVDCAAAVRELEEILKEEETSETVS